MQGLIKGEGTYAIMFPILVLTAMCLGLPAIGAHPSEVILLYLTEADLNCTSASSSLIQAQLGCCIKD